MRTSSETTSSGFRLYHMSSSVHASFDLVFVAPLVFFVDGASARLGFVSNMFAFIRSVGIAKWSICEYDIYSRCGLAQLSCFPVCPGNSRTSNARAVLRIKSAQYIGEYDGRPEGKGRLGG